MYSVQLGFGVPKDLPQGLNPRRCSKKLHYMLFGCSDAYTFMSRRNSRIAKETPSEHRCCDSDECPAQQNRLVSHAGRAILDPWSEWLAKNPDNTQNPPAANLSPAEIKARFS